MSVRSTSHAAACATLLIAAPAVQAQVYTGTFSGTVTTSEINDIPYSGPPTTYNFNGQSISGTFRIDLSAGYTVARYDVALPAFAFSGEASDSEIEPYDPFDQVMFNVAAGQASLLISPNLYGWDSAAVFRLMFNMSALNDPATPLTGTGRYSFFYNYGGTNGNDLAGEINFAVTGGTLSAIPEPAEWVLLIGGFALGGAALRVRTRPRRIAFA